jgi:hypothetical protein
MLRVYVQKYLALGEQIYNARIASMIASEGRYVSSDPKRREEEEKEKENMRESLKQNLVSLEEFCSELNLPVSLNLISGKIDNLPKTMAEVDLLTQAIWAELESKLFLFVPSHVASYYEFDDIITDAAKLAFPSAYAELREAGNCLAVGLSTACVFHSMRAAEIGVHVLGKSLGVSFPNHPIDLAEWQNILDQADSKIVAKKNLSKGTQKDEELNFYSQAAIQFRYFKDAWRVRVAHARAVYSEGQAKEVIDHVRSFFDALAVRLSE